MAKAKAKKKGGKKEGSGGADGGDLTPEQTITLLKAENDSLRRQLAARQDETTTALHSRKVMHDTVSELRVSFEAKTNETYELTRDMTRQYKAMQLELLTKISDLEAQNEMLKKKLKEQQEANDAAKVEFEKVLSIKEEEVEKLKQQMEEMAQEFGDMLKETLDKLGERIEINVVKSMKGASMGQERSQLETMQQQMLDEMNR